MSPGPPRAAVMLHPHTILHGPRPDGTDATRVLPMRQEVLPWLQPPGIRVRSVPGRRTAWRRGRIFQLPHPSAATSAPCCEAAAEPPKNQSRSRRRSRSERAEQEHTGRRSGGRRYAIPSLRNTTPIRSSARRRAAASCSISPAVPAIVFTNSDGA